MTRLLLCTDLDRTLLPNGDAFESPHAREIFSRIVSVPGVTLAYVTGRDRNLVEAALGDYHLPVPDYVIGDVGATIHAIDNGQWHDWIAWSRYIAVNWNGMHSMQLAPLLKSVPGLRIQEEDKQNTYKLSYYTSPSIDIASLKDSIHERLAGRNLHVNLIWSLDDNTNTGLLDILPRRAGKLQALEFLHQSLGFDYSRTLFAGDSGNDLPVLASAIPSVLVANATPTVAGQAVAAARKAGTEQALYLARGGFLGLNGNYAAGIIEGIAHFHPDIVQAMENPHA